MASLKEKVAVCLVLDPEVRETLVEKSRETDIPMSRIVNQALRRIFQMDGQKPLNASLVRRLASPPEAPNQS